MPEQDQHDIYKALVEGTNRKGKEIEIDTPAGTLEGVLQPLSRKKRWDYINTIPEGFLQAAQELDRDDIEAGEVDSEEIAEKYNTLPTGDMMAAFTDMVSEKFSIQGLSPSQKRELIEKAFSDELLLELGFEILNVSASSEGIEGFREANE